MIRPTIIWALDDHVRPYVETWTNKLSTDESLFVKQADGWEEVRDHLSVYNDVDMDDMLCAKGVGEHGAGTHVNLIMIAYGMGELAFSDWKEIQDRVSKLQKAVVHVEQHHIVFAIHENHKLENRFITTDGLEIAPWLLSSRTSKYQTRGEGQLTRILHQLLNTLIYTDRPLFLADASPLGRFLEEPEVPGNVRLLGTPSLSIDNLIEQIAFDCAAGTANRVLILAREDQKRGAGFHPEVQELVNDFCEGKKNLSHLGKILLGTEGMAGSDLGFLLIRGQRTAQSLQKRIMEAVKSWGATQIHRGSTGKSGFWRRLLSSIGFRKSDTDLNDPADNDEFNLVMYEEELEPLIENLQAAASLFDAMSSWIHKNKNKEKVFLPVSHLGPWRDFLGEQVKDKLTLASKGNLDSVLAKKIINALEKKISEDLEDDLMNHLVEGKWAETHPDSLKLRLMGEDKFFFFSGAVKQGSDVSSITGICSKTGPLLSANDFDQIKLWGFNRADLLRVSLPIPVSDLRW